MLSQNSHHDTINSSSASPCSPVFVLKGWRAPPHTNQSICSSTDSVLSPVLRVAPTEDHRTVLECGLGKPQKKTVSDVAMRVRKCREKKRLLQGIDVQGKTDEEKARQLRVLLEAKEMKGALDSLPGFRREKEVEVALFHQQQASHMLHMALGEKESRHARVSDERRGFVESVLVSMAPHCTKEEEHGHWTKLGSTPSDTTTPVCASMPSTGARLKALGLSKSTGYRLAKKATQKRMKLTRREENVSWNIVEARRGHRKVTDAMRKALHEWILAHPRVVESPIANDTLLVKDPATGERVRVAKLLLEIPVRELHNDMIERAIEEGGKGGGLPEARDKHGNVLISDTALRYLMPTHLKPATERHKLMCGCEICLLSDGLQKTLNAWRRRFKKKLEQDAASFPPGSNDQKKASEIASLYQPCLNETPPLNWHAKAKDALQSMQCPCIDRLGLPHMRCILGECTQCPAYPCPREEQATGPAAPTINFHIYKTVTRCSKHGLLMLNSKVCAHCEQDDSQAAEERKKAKVSIFANV